MTSQAAAKPRRSAALARAEGSSEIRSWRLQDPEVPKAFMVCVLSRDYIVDIKCST